MNISKSLHTICQELNYYNYEFDANPCDTFNSHDPTSFAQIVRIFGDDYLSNISPAEIDYAFNTLLRDTALFQSNNDVYINLIKYLIYTIRELMNNQKTNKDKYRKEYARFMIEREKYRTDITTQFITDYNNKIIDGMLSRK